VTQDMLQKGVDIIRKETLEKVALLAEVVAETEHFNWLVKDETFRSPTVIALESSLSQEKIIATLKGKGLIIGKGYGSGTENQIRIANFPAHSVSDFQQLCEAMKSFN
ncbi:MAG: phosphoserine aminotransferase, partial [Bacteroidia bacterium]